MSCTNDVGTKSIVVSGGTYAVRRRQNVDEGGSFVQKTDTHPMPAVRLDELMTTSPPKTPKVGPRRTGDDYESFDEERISCESAQISLVHRLK